MSRNGLPYRVNENNEKGLSASDREVRKMPLRTSWLTEVQETRRSSPGQARGTGR